MTPAEIERIIGVAASLSERIANAGDGDVTDSSLADSRFARWRTQTSQNNPEKFKVRLSWQGIAEEDSHRFLAQTGVLFTDPEPEWVAVARGLLTFLASDPQIGSQCPQVEAGILFPDTLSPIAEFAERDRTIIPRVLRVSSAALESIRASLYSALSGVCALCLGEEFERFRRGRGWAPGDGRGSKELYQAFVATMGPSGWLVIFNRYPVLARLVATRIRQWTDDTKEFLRRLSEDLPAVEGAFFDSSALPRVAHIQSSMSDTHNSGRAVRVVTFEDGCRIVYKPRSLAIDMAWLGLTQWLGERENGFRIRAPRVVSRLDYGWAEFIEPKPCHDMSEIREFYRRAGMLLCLLFVLRGNDFHQENLIASGPDPIPVDLETLFVPDVRTVAKSNTFGKIASSPGFNRTLGTVLQTWLLPFWMPGPDGRSALDVSGLGSPTCSQDGGEGKGWSNINSDAMLFGKCPVEVAPYLNHPTMGGKPVDAAEFVPEISSGFEHAYRILIRRHAEIVAPDGPLAAFRDCAARVVLRPTRVYADLTLRSLAPRFLRNGVDRSLELEVLSRSFLIPDLQYNGGRIFLAELEALERLDIPFFHAHPALDFLIVDGTERVPEVLERPAFLAVTEGLESLNEEDLDYQLELIRSSFAARDLRPESSPTRLRKIPNEVAFTSVGRDALVTRARGIAARIARRAVWDGAGARWLGLDFHHAINRCCLHDVTQSLYSGRAGIAMFFAALHAVGAKDPEYLRLALGAARSVRDDFWGRGLDSDGTRAVARSCGIGMAAGIPGIAYALFVAARLLNDDALMTDAIRTAKLVDLKLIDDDRRFDIMSGAAGTIVGLLPLWKHTGDPFFLDCAVQAAELLVRHQANSDGNAGGWQSFAPEPLSGFSHGAAGVALALTRAAAATGNDVFLDAARRAIEFEDSLFAAAENNWKRCRGSSDDVLPAAWCYGAPGIALARLGCWTCDASVGANRLLDDISAGVQWLEAHPIDPRDHVCCGEFGNIELLLEGGRTLDRQEWVRAAERRVAFVLARADVDPGGLHSMVGPTESMFTPGFFNGLAGMGYQMLRLADTDARLPSVLLWN